MTPQHAEIKGGFTDAQHGFVCHAAGLIQTRIITVHAPPSGTQAVARIDGATLTV